jgi:hypothetical protein
VDVALYTDANCGHTEDKEAGFDKIPCCSNDQIVLFAESHVLGADIAESVSTEFIPIAFFLKYHGVDIVNEGVEVHNSRAGPPDVGSSKLYLLHSSLIHYG